jgi:hypothetical protein
MVERGCILREKFSYTFLEAVHVVVGEPVGAGGSTTVVRLSGPARTSRDKSLTIRSSDTRPSQTERGTHSVDTLRKKPREKVGHPPLKELAAYSGPLA